jgi:lysophospholipase
MTRFISIDANPIPAGAEASEFIADDGARLRTAFFPTAGATKTIIVAPGWAEFIEKYFEVADELRERDFNVAIMDWRGQGLSDTPSAWGGYFDRIADDLRAFREGPAETRFPGPCYLLTHSMGGLPALMLLGKGYDRFERAVLCAPLTRLFPPATNVVLGAAASAASALGAGNAPVARKNDNARVFEGNMFTTDPARHGRFRDLQDAEPAAALTAPTFGWVKEAMRASKMIHEKGFFDSLKVPIRIISAGAERRVDGADHANIAGRNTLIDHIVVEGALHEIMMERDELRDAFWDNVDAFLEDGAEG